MARESGTFESELDYEINSMHRAEKAMEFSNHHHAYDIIVSALESGAFVNRTIVLDGDSLTRQLFISLSCLSWSAGFVEEYDIHAKVTTSNPVLESTAYKYPSTFFNSGYVRLRGGIEIYYYDKQSESRIKRETEEFVAIACNTSSPEEMPPSKQKLRVNVSKRTAGRNTIALNENDIFIVSAGHHATRELYMNAYKKAFQCLESDRDAIRFKRWPHILYQTSSVSSFWTTSGEYENGNNLMAGKEKNSCREYVDVARSVRRSEERAQLGNLTSITLLGNSLQLEDLGGLHPWHKDCLHWIQPGIPDVFAAHLADYVMSI